MRMTEMKMKVSERDLVFFDTEMTGVALGQEILEIGFVKAKAGTFEVLAEGDIKILPKHIELAEPAALAINGYDEAEWAKEGVELKVGLEMFLSHTSEAILVGHNLPFDWMHFHKGLLDCGLEPNFFYKGFDTFPIAWSKLRDDPKFIKFSLEELGTHFDIDRGRAHRAIDDARTPYQVFLALMKHEA